MRDPARIDKILAQLANLWKQHPDLRLGQLIANTSINRNDPLFYNIEDQDLIDLLVEFYGGLKNENH